MKINYPKLIIIGFILLIFHTIISAWLGVRLATMFTILVPFIALSLKKKYM